MSINGMMRTSISGMTAQSARLSSVSANIANSSTVGYKSAETLFSSLLIDAPGTSYNSGGVEASTRYAISRQGVLTRTASQFDLAIRGSGFLLVENANGAVSLTRAGAFVPDADGHMVNAAGFKLLGMPLNGSAGPLPINSTAGLVPINISPVRLEAVPTTAGSLLANVPSAADPIAAADLPSQNAAGSSSSARTSVVVYGNLGEEITLDVYYARTTTPGEWEMTVFDAAGRDAGGGFPYSSGPLAQSTLVFDASGQLDPSVVSTLNVPVPGGSTLELDIAGTSQLAAEFSVRSVSTNGNPPSDPSSIDISDDGIMYAAYDNGTRRAMWQIPLATVASPDRLAPMTGNVFAVTADSGDLRIGAPGSAGFGGIVSGALESSTVDLSAELTDMIEAQRNYTANSRVFQTGAELMEVLVNLKR